MSKAMDLLSLVPKYPKRKRTERFHVFELLRSSSSSSSKDDMKRTVTADDDRRDQKRRAININKADAAAITVPPPDWVKAKFCSMGTTDDPLRSMMSKAAATVPPSTDPVMTKFHSIGATGDPLQRVMTKNVTPSDADRAHNRLLLPKKTVVESRLLEGLTEAERNLVGKEEENKKGPKPKGLQVVMVDGEGRSYDVVLKFLTSNNAYRIIGKNYIEFVANNNLTPVLDTVHLCLFRVKDDWGQTKLKLGVVKTTQDAEEKAMLPEAPVHEDEEEVLRCRAIYEGKRPLLEEEEEEEEVLRLRDIRNSKEEVLRLQPIGEGMRPLLMFDLNLPPSEDSIA